MQNESHTRVLVTPDDLVGFEIDGRYRLDAIVGGGGMGVVYRTTQHNLNRDIAIKLLKLDDNDGKHRIERFKREIDIIAQLTHPNIVRVFDTGRDPILGLHYIAMELVEGGSLADLMRGHRMRPVLAIDIAYEIAAALTEPHRLGIVHRDIKPANVLVTPRSDDTVGVKVVDFGIARSQASGGSKITTTGVVVGSPMYMAPEVARGETLDGRTDLYSLGVLMYEMVTGDTPFRGSTPVAIMLRHAVEEPPSLAESVDKEFAVPELVELVDTMLSKERKRRPADAKAVMRRLDAIRAAHQMTRVEIDSALPLAEALAPYLVATSIPSDTPECDPYSPTTPVDLDQTYRSDSFSGWLVSDDARAALRETIHGGTPIVDAPPKPRSFNGPALAVAALSVAIGVGVAVWGMRDTPPAGGEPEVVELGAPPPRIEAPEPQPTPAAAVVATDVAEDVGRSADLEQPVPATPDDTPVVTERTSPKPRDKPAGEEEKSGATDEFQKGMEWLHKK